MHEAECLTAMQTWNTGIALSGFATRWLFIPAVVILFITAAIKNPSVATVTMAIASPALGMFAQWLILMIAGSIMTSIKIFPMRKLVVHVVYSCAFVVWPIASATCILVGIYRAWIK